MSLLFHFDPSKVEHQELHGGGAGGRQRRFESGSVDALLPRSARLRGKRFVIHQDNQSAMLLEKNGKMSSGKRTRHINIRYFFVTDRVQNNEISIEYCPTDAMIGDLFTKPLQGQKFRLFRDTILNYHPDKKEKDVMHQMTTSQSAHRSVLAGNVCDKKVTWADKVKTGTTEHDARNKKDMTTPRDDKVTGTNGTATKMADGSMNDHEMTN